MRVAVFHKATTPTRRKRLHKTLAQELEQFLPVTSASGLGAQIAIEICELEGWTYTLTMDPKTGFCIVERR